ncbi:PRC-barrel domain containing protein [Lentzea nigeriaca]|uniref:PRC-barrel domain containing protein n=1 Tax=Lentzea nigeriaca TaxID=1128665 RepID=UPI00195D24A8|nr:PRC-barrel domain containing protein [Lentzea nigeriaca]MBM7863802.1 sporulation protein YlmC with PRC-barrel domain [Lentzea nigeriaca]
MLASDLLGRTVRDRAGNPLGRVADLLTEPDEHGRHRVVRVLVTPRWRGRLLGFERPGIQRPWLLERISYLLHRGTREVPWEDVDWSSE